VVREIQQSENVNTSNVQSLTSHSTNNRSFHRWIISGTDTDSWIHNKQETIHTRTDDKTNWLYTMFR